IAILLLIVAALWWVLKPLWQGASRPVNVVSLEELSLAKLEQRRDNLYSAIKDLELDYEAGKISDADYRQVRAGFTQQAAGVLKQIDHLSQYTDARLEARIDTLLAEAAPAGANDPLRAGARAQIWQDAQTGHTLTCPRCAAPAHPEDIFCSRCGASLTNLCPNCQNATAPGDAFCTHCGARLAVEVAQ
ncbi:MAG: zinc ribbon domain-containing protein, partial [Anaerolineae bacterium]